MQITYKEKFKIGSKLVIKLRQDDILIIMPTKKSFTDNPFMPIKIIVSELTEHTIVIKNLDSSDNDDFYRILIDDFYSLFSVIEYLGNRND